MGYLQNIKSPEAYVNSMRVALSDMPETEREEACEEVRQHLGSLVEDFHADCHSSEEAMMLAIEQFGHPLKVGFQIGQKWRQKNEERNEERIEAAKFPAFKRKERLLAVVDQISSCLPIPVLIFAFYRHSLPWVFLLPATLGLQSGIINAYRQALRDQVWEPQGISPQRRLEASIPKVRLRLLRDRTWRGRLTFVVVRLIGQQLMSWVGLSERRTHLNWKWNTSAITWGGFYLLLLVLWPDDSGWQSLLKQMIVFPYVFTRAFTISKVLTNHLLLRGQTA